MKSIWESFCLPLTAEIYVTFQVMWKIKRDCFGLGFREGWWEEGQCGRSPPQPSTGNGNSSSEQLDEISKFYWFIEAFHQPPHHWTTYKQPSHYCLIYSHSIKIKRFHSRPPGLSSPSISTTTTPHSITSYSSVNEVAAAKNTFVGCRRPGHRAAGSLLQELLLITDVGLCYTGRAGGKVRSSSTDLAAGCSSGDEDGLPHLSRGSARLPPHHMNHALEIDGPSRTVTRVHVSFS